MHSHPIRISRCESVKHTKTAAEFYITAPLPRHLQRLPQPSRTANSVGPRSLSLVKTRYKLSLDCLTVEKSGE